jgi:dCMP deaminase
VRDGRPIGGGYNGAPKFSPQCIDRGVGCEALVGPGETLDAIKVEQRLAEHGCQRAIHAEANAVAWAARQGVLLEGSTMYSTHAPCKGCAQLIVASKISTFFYVNDYRADRLDLLDQAAIQITQL